MKIICRLSFLILILLFMSSFSSQSKSADDILGTWLVGSKKAKVRIFKKSDKYYGKIIWLRDKNDDGTEKKDLNNPDKSKRDRSIVGLEMLESFEYDGDWEWEDGEIYDPESGKTYSCVITMENLNKLDVRGYVGFSWIGRSDTWTRVD